MLKVQRAAHVAQLIVKLQSWGYDSNAVKPVAKVVEKLDSAALSLVERLAGDLTQLGENSRDLKVQVSTLSDDLDHEKQLLERLRVENQRLLKANSELRAQVSHRETRTHAMSCSVIRASRDRMQIFIISGTVMASSSHPPPSSS
jgi:DNA integrity scanning protein DisA with diadenylate cyclase activity